MMRYAISRPDGRLVQTFSGSGNLLSIFWTAEAKLCRWWKSRGLAEQYLEAVQAREPEAQLVERETLDL